MGVSGRDLLRECGGRVQASTRAACHSQSDKVAAASSVLMNSGLSEEEAAGTVRLSVGRHTTEQEVRSAAAWLREAYSRLAKEGRKI